MRLYSEFEKIFAALAIFKGWADKCTLEHRVKDAVEAIAELKKIEQNTLPTLPEGYVLFRLSNPQTKNKTGWTACISKIEQRVRPYGKALVRVATFNGEGPTPRAAILNALNKISALTQFGDRP